MQHRKTVRLHRNGYWLLSSVLVSLACAAVANEVLREQAVAGSRLAQEVPRTTGQVESVSNAPWHGTISAGLSLTRGYRDTMLVTMSARAERKTETDVLGFALAGGYGIARLNGESQTTTEYVRGSAGYDHMLGQRAYVGLQLRAEYDAMLGIDCRVTVTPMVGYYLIRSKRTTLAVETGPTFVVEKLDHDRFTVRGAGYVGERFEYRFDSKALFWQRFQWYPDFAEWPELYSIRAEVGLETPITAQLGFRTVVESNYESRPPGGREEHELRLVSGLSYRF